MMPAALSIPIVDFELPFDLVVLGVITGLTYALVAVGLTLVYRTSRVLNFAHGEMGAVPAVVLPVLVVNQGWGYWPAVAAALAISVAVGALMELLVVRRLAHAPRLVMLVATIGVAQFLFVVGSAIPKSGRLGASTFPTPFTASVTIGDLRLGAGQLPILAVVPAVTLALTLFLRRARLGIAARAAAENEDTARSVGVPVRRVSLAIWTIAGLLAGASALLLGPTRPMVTEEALGPSLLLRALAAATIGGLSNLPMVFAGGVAIGIIELLIMWNYPTGGALELVLFAVIIVSLLVRSDLGQLVRGGEDSSWSLAGTLRQLEPRVRALRVVRTARLIGLALLLTASVALPLPLDNGQRVLASSIVLFAVMSLSLVVLTGYAGQVSLGQFAFVGLGAIVGGRMAQLGFPVWMGVLYAVGSGGLVALVVGLPALRIRGLFLGVTTLGFAVASTTWLFHQPWLVQATATQTSLSMPRPTLLGVSFQSERNYYWLCLAVLVVSACLVWHLRSTGIGRAMMAVRDNEAAAAAMSVPPRRVKLVAFMLSGMIASLAGYFYGGLLANFSDLSVFGPEHSLQLVAMAILGGVTTVTGAILGAAFIQGSAHFVAPLVPGLLGDNVALLFSGVGLLVVVIQFPGGIATLAFEARDRLLARLTDEHSPATGDPKAGEHQPVPVRLTPREANRSVDGPSGRIEAVDVSVSFGGNSVLDSVSVHADAGEIVGLVGPNGAGKTTLFDVLSGQLHPATGRVLLEDQDVTSLRPEQRAVRGLGRSFQQARLFGEMPLRDAFKIALECEEPSEFVPSVLALPPSRDAERVKDLRADELLELLGLERYARFNVKELSTGTRRLAELGCIIGMRARVLLLDEPMAGVAQREVEAFQPVLRDIRDHLGASVLIIDHDIPMITGLVDRLYVLAAGKVIADGPPTVLREDPAVIAAYLGTDERVIARSGAASVVTGTAEPTPADTARAAGSVATEQER